MNGVLPRAAAALVAVVVLGVGVRLLMDATLTRHHPVAPDTSLVVTLDARTRGGAEHPVESMVAGLATVCHLEVGAALVPGSVTHVGGDRFRFVLRPTLDDADRRQLRGCLQDARVDHLWASVVAMHDGPSAEA